jgi:hypothetical protein
LNAVLKSPEGLNAIVEDVEDLMAERMEIALKRGWTDWQEYQIKERHASLLKQPGALVEVRFKYPGAVFMEIELRYDTRGGWTHLYPDANEWWFPGLEDETEARETREANDKPLKAY